MWSDRSKRPLIVVGVLVALAVGGGALWWWNSQAPKRHLESLIEMSFDFAELDGPSSFSKYDRQTYTACVAETGDDGWRAFYGGSSAFGDDGDPDVNASAERAAQRFEAAGWDVERYVAPSSDERVDDRRYVWAQLDDDTVQMFFVTVSLEVVATTGPCNDANYDLDPPPGAASPVDSFPG